MNTDGPVVYTGGTFDLFHAGHAHLLRQCRTLAGARGRVVVGLNHDRFISLYKGKPPIMPYEERYAILLACRYVDKIVCHDCGMDSKPTIIRVRPSIIAIGIDWATKDYYKQMGFTQDWLDDMDITLVYLPHLPGLSSTRVKERVDER